MLTSVRDAAVMAADDRTRWVLSDTDDQMDVDDEDTEPEDDVEGERDRERDREPAVDDDHEPGDR